MKKQKLLILLAVLVLQSLAVAIEIPAVLPDPSPLPPSTAKPVKVFILSGQSNMVGMGRISPFGTLGTLETITKKDGMFPYLIDNSGNWTVRNDVYYRGVVTAIGNGPLTPGVMGSNMGTEMGFGHVMGYYHDEPVIVLKSSQGNRSISWDFAPPSTERFDWTDGNDDEWTYAAYGETPGRWPTGGTADSVNWYAGKQYDDCFLDEADWAPAGSGSIENVTDVLDNFASEYPQFAKQGFEIAGFGWWQGHKDQGEPHASRYEQNMVRFIKDLRDYYEDRYPNNIKKDAPFVLATVAFDGGWDNTSAGYLAIANGQLAVSGEMGNYPEFEGNVKTVEARGFWRDSSVSPTTAGYHYNGNAETYMLVGDAMGRAIAEMLVYDDPGTSPTIISPEYGDVEAPGNVEFQWVNLDPNTNDASKTYVDIWFGTDPNKLSDNYTKIVTGQSISSHTFTPPGPGIYYWQVDSYLNGDPGIIDYTDGDPCMLQGHPYVFTNDAQIESVDILANATITDKIIWSGQPVPLETAIVDDDGSNLSYLWTANAPAGVTVSFDPGADDPSPAITFTKDFSAISIVNGGFEDPIRTDGSYTSSSSPGWIRTGGAAGIWNPGDPNSSGYQAYGGIAPEGENVIWVNGGVSVSQVLTETLTFDSTYILSVKVGKNVSYASSTYKVEVLVGDTIIAKDDNSINTGVEVFRTSSMIFDSSDAEPNKIGLPLQIRLSCKSPVSGEFNFDDVRLSVTPDRPISGSVSAVTVKLAVNDETNPAITDTMTFDVYDTACMAARYGFGLSLETDYDENCLTGPEDLATMIAAWLDDTSAIEAYIGFVPAPTWNGTTITGTVGNKNTWNQDDNWDNGVPSGTVDAIVADGVYAQVDSPDTPAYDGSLILGVGSTLQLGWTTKANSQNRNALGNDQIVMNDGSVIISRSGFENYTFNQKIVLEGNGTIWPGISTACHGSTKTLAGEIYGPGTLIWNGVNRTWGKITRANPNWTGGFKTADPQNQRHRFEVMADGAFGTGDVTIDKNCSLYIASGLSDTIADDATLYLNGIGSTDAVNDSKLVLNSNETVAAFYLEGVKQADGTYNSTSTLTDSAGNPLISGNGSLIVASPDPTLPSVDAGGNIFTASGITMTMAPTVVNNDQEPQGSLTYAWSAEPADGVDITNADQENATVTITKAAPTGGIEIVTMTLSVTLDGKAAVTDNVDVAVYDDGCELIKDVDPSKVAPTDHVGNDCLTNIADFAVLAADWLEDYALAAPQDKPAE